MLLFLYIDDLWLHNKDRTCCLFMMSVDTTHGLEGVIVNKAGVYLFDRWYRLLNRFYESKTIATAIQFLRHQQTPYSIGLLERMVQSSIFYSFNQLYHPLLGRSFTIDTLSLLLLTSGSYLSIYSFHYQLHAPLFLCEYKECSLDNQTYCSSYASKELNLFGVFLRVVACI